MKKQNLFVLAGSIAFIMATSCKQKTSVENVVALAIHAHKDTIEEIVDDLLITSRQYKAAGIELSKLQTTNLAGSIRVTGVLEAPTQSLAGISTYLGGIIKSILVSPGSYVRKGQTVMTLEHPDFLKLQEEYTSTKNNLVFLEQDLERKKELISGNATSGKSLQEAESRHNVEKSRLASIASKLSMLGISTEELNKGNLSRILALRSPISGYVTHIHGSLGSYAEPNKNLFEVVDNSNILVRLDVYEQDFYKINSGTKVIIILPNQNNQQIEGSIVTLGKAMDPVTKSIPVYAEIRNNKRQDLIPGIYVNAELYLNGHKATVAPTEAVIRSGEKQYLFIVNEELCSNPNVPGKDPYTVKDVAGNTISLAYRMIEVKTGAEDKGMVEINPSQPILLTDQVVMKGAYYLMSALKSGETVGCCAPAEDEAKN
jgi:cobalt-zinc-cadmium efflux system membrane fusion protein